MKQIRAPYEADIPVILNSTMEKFNLGLRAAALAVHQWKPARDRSSRRLLSERFHGAPVTSRYPPECVKQLVAAIAAAAGVSKLDAEILADALVDADLHGTSTHGVPASTFHLSHSKRFDQPGSELTVSRRRGSTLAIDAGNGLGQVQAVKVLVGTLTPMAAEQGIAAATIRHSQHIRALSYYCNKAAAADMILFATTNCEPAMSPEGACQAYFGTNPLAASFPTGKGWPVKIDLATSIIARGNIIAAQKRGQPITPGLALTVTGNLRRMPLPPWRNAPYHGRAQRLCARLDGGMFFRSSKWGLNGFSGRSD